MTNALPEPAEAVIGAVDSKISAVRTQSIDFSFNELADMYRTGELIIDPDFQRMFRWTEGAQSRFIESLLLELPIPPIFLIERESRVYELIDGLQRLSSYLHFRGQLPNENGETVGLRLMDCDIVNELNGKTLGDLPRALDIKLKRSYVRAEILRKESDPRLRYYMFKRLNVGGERLSDQEVRNATIRLLSNDFNQFIVELSRDENFKACIASISENQRKRKFDQELVLRFFAFKNNITGFRHEVGDFLTEYMESVSDPNPDVGVVRDFDYVREREVFEKTFAVLALASRVPAVDGKVLEDRIFGSVTQGSTEPRGQFSVYHFEGITVGLQKALPLVSIEDAVAISQLGEVLRVGKSDPEFLKSTGSGKNDQNPLRERVRYFADAFLAALQ